jgi:hypothetical protein
MDNLLRDFRTLYIPFRERSYFDEDPNASIDFEPSRIDTGLEFKYDEEKGKFIIRSFIGSSSDKTPYLTFELRKFPTHKDVDKIKEATSLYQETELEGDR